MTQHERTHYEVLGIPNSANSAEIWEAKRNRLAEADSDAEITRIEKAYQILSNRDLRIRYDTDLHVQARMRGEFVKPKPINAPLPRKTSDSIFSKSQPRPRDSDPPRWGPYGKRRPTTPIGWALFVVSIAVFIFTQISSFEGNSDSSSDGVYGFLTSQARAHEEVIGRLADQNATQRATFSQGGQTQREILSSDPVPYYELGLEQLAESTAVNDRSEVRAVGFFNQAKLFDSDNPLVYRELAVTYFNRWVFDDMAFHHAQAREHMVEYLVLINESTSLSADEYYALGLEERTQSTEVNDAAEADAVAYFMQTLLTDSDYAPAYERLAEIYFNRWEVGERGLDRIVVAEYRRRFASVSDSTRDSETQTTPNAGSE